MNILVTGANGQLGNELRIVTKGSADKYIFTDVVDASEESITMLKKLAGDDICTDTMHLDITDIEAVRQVIQEQEVQVVVNCAAYTNVDKAEENYEQAELLNAKAVENLAIAVKEVDGMLLHISTDYVFGGDPCNTPIKEEQQVAPTGVYGLTKLHGEEAIQRVGCKHIIIRTAWLYSEFGKNFVKTMLNLTTYRPQLKVVFDQVGTPTYALDLANAILAVIKDYQLSLISKHSTLNYSKSGIYHFSNEGVTSWYDFAKMIAKMVGNTACDIQPCHSNEYPSTVKRPAYSVLDKTKIKEAFGLKIPYWTDSLRKCINNMGVDV
jgi:dTDP-4-dehydrorhamnose reductase